MRFFNGLYSVQKRPKCSLTKFVRWRWLKAQMPQKRAAWPQGDYERSNYRYKAFISYKHVSTTFALRLEQALKAYAKPLLTRPIRVFRDEKHLSPGVDLPNLIVDALDASEFLILLASPDAAGSPWVRDEIDHWCRHLQRTQNLIIVLTAGEIATDNRTKGIDWTRTNALPAVLEPYLERMPLYVDLRKNALIDELSLANLDFKTAVNSITARFRGLDPNDMLGEEITQHRRNLRLRNWAISTLAVLTVFSLSAAVVAVIQRDEARQQTRIALSRQYAAEAASLVDKNLDEAILRAVKAVTTIETFEARNVLFQALLHSPKIEAFLHPIRGDIASFNEAGNQFALATSNVVRIFELTDDSRPNSWEVRTSLSNISSVVYNHLGSMIAIGGNDGSISLLNTSKRTTMNLSVKLSDNPITRLFFNAADDKLFAVSDGQVFRSSVSSDNLSLTEQALILDARSNITANSADGRLLAIGDGKRVVVWDLSGPIHQSLSFDVGRNIQFTVGIVEASFNLSGEILALDLMAGSDGIPVSFVELYYIGSPTHPTSELEPPKLLHSFITEKSVANPRLAFDNTGDNFLIADRDATFRVIQLKTLKPNERTDLATSRMFANEVKGLSGIVREPHYSPDGKRLLLKVGTRTILWNNGAPQSLSHTFAVHNYVPKSISFSKDGQTLVLVTFNGSVYRWDMHGNKPAFVKDEHQALLSKAATTEESLDGWMPLAASLDRSLLAEFKDGVLRVRNGTTLAEAWRTQLYNEKQRPLGGTPGVSFSVDGRRMVVHVLGAWELTVWNTASGRQIEVFDVGEDQSVNWAPAISWDDRWIATPIRYNTFAVINTRTREVTIVESPRGSFCSAAFSPNSEYLAIAYESEETSINDSADSRYHPPDYGILFWNIAGKRWDVPSIKVAARSCDFAFNPAGDRLAIATSPEDHDEEGQVLVWDIKPTFWTKVGLERIMYKPLSKVN
jgi:WD40 repeat protein